ncbi:MAG: SDR family NAD(P)-dependent oxidoreductase [Desulfobacula sp.]|nr:SDR family NAD(P)-dependent oxidoreductase [Desulfobacula sp.]
MKTILITGASGFIGQKICDRLFTDYKVIAFDKIKSRPEMSKPYVQFGGDILNKKHIIKICRKYDLDIVIHCAGIAHQKANSNLCAKDYELVNHQATINLLEIVLKENSDIHFIFLSSISVYGENENGVALKEGEQCYPSTPYAQSKANAENSLIKMFNKKILKKLDILRLAPVYDSQWSLNLEKRVFGPKKICYVKFGSGNQMMSTLSRLNLTNFIDNRIKNQDSDFFCDIYNVTDKRPYSFNQIIEIFKQSQYQPWRLTIKIPLGLIWIGTIVLAKIFLGKSKWIKSCYDKLAYNLIFDNKKMLDTGFDPEQTLESVFLKKMKF